MVKKFLEDCQKKEKENNVNGDSHRVNSSIKACSGTSSKDRSLKNCENVDEKKDESEI